MAGTYFAQAREYRPVIGRFTARDIIKGTVDDRTSQNEYLYCRNAPMDYLDLNGAIVITSTLAIIGIGALVGAAGGGITNAVSQKIKRDKGEQEGFKWGELVGSAVEGAIVGGIAAIPGTGTIASFVSTVIAGGVGSAANSTLSQGIDEGKVNGFKVLEDGVVGAIVSGTFYGIGEKIKPLKNQLKSALGISTLPKESALIKNEVKKIQVH